MTPPVPDLVLYTRPGCHLCEATKTTLGLLLADRVARGVPVPAVVERDIESDPALHRAMLELIPVIELGARRLDLAIGPAKLRRFLADALDDERSPEDERPSDLDRAREPHSEPVQS